MSDTQHIEALANAIQAQAAHWANMAEIDNGDAAVVARERHHGLVGQLASLARQQQAEPEDRNLIPQAFDRFNGCRRGLGDYGAFKLALGEALSRYARELAVSMTASQAEPAREAVEHYDEVKATLQGAHSIMESLSANERRIGPLGSHGRGYTHKITAALRHLDALYALAHPAPAAAPAAEPKHWTADAEAWGRALNDASWEFINVCPEKSALLFNNCKTALRAAILKYAFEVAKETPPATPAATAPQAGATCHRIDVPEFPSMPSMMADWPAEKLWLQACLTGYRCSLSTAPQPERQDVRHPTTEQLDEALAERQYPSNPHNAARAGWYAALKAHGLFDKLPPNAALATQAKE